MDIEQLIKEQQETRKILKKIEKAGTLEKFLAGLDEAPPQGNYNWHQWVSPWDYDGVNDVRQTYLETAIRKATESLQEVKYFLHYLDNAYKGYIKEWGQYKAMCDEHNATKKARAKAYDWTDLYTHPECIDFFEKYEKDHNIKDSIYQQAKAIREKKK